MEELSKKDDYVYEVVTDELFEQKKLGIIPAWVEPNFIYLDEEGAKYADHTYSHHMEEGHGYHTVYEIEEERYVLFMSKETIEKEVERLKEEEGELLEKRNKR